MVKEQTKAYDRLRLSYILYILCLLHASATLVAILTEVLYK